MTPKHAKTIQELLQYEEDTAGALMRAEVFTLLDTYTAQKALQVIRKQRPPTAQIHVLLIVDNKNHLLGTISMRTLLTAKQTTKLRNIMRKNPITVFPHATKKDIATVLEKYNFVILPVVDDNNMLCGTVSADEVLSEIMPQSWIKEKYIPTQAKKQRK